ncbi:putative trans-zeatin O-beta-D-glucosyltransferase [Helianthus annuus]|uniref:Glycosyltransferase n=1 Tax=Helianthus annuus TaxID=4232 RepID=A0A251VS68_HELAN|nr:putative trans-zeatin O-beta-D-glucosyltransferase [Helianthus annuus]
MASPPTNLHFVLFPWPAQGHLIPMVDIARMLAERDVMVTVITTPVNTNRIKTVIDRAIEANLKIQVLDIQLPFAKAGLPEGCESFDMIPSVSYVANMFLAMKLLEEPAEEMLRVLYPPPSCIISDGGFHWTSDVAKRLIASSWGKGNTKETRETFERTQEAEKAAFGIVVNSFDALEPKYVEEFAKATGKKVWCIGPVSLCNKSLEDIAERGNKAANGEHDCLKWLDSREPRSVVYVCFGSFSSTLTHQAIELALGLESSNIPFVWFVSRTSDEFEKWTSEGQYEERIKGRGLMVRGWAPQILVLSHQAIGGFITHCGWNSTLEAICAGIPMVTWPHFADQFLNERFIVNVLKIGLKIGVEVPITYRGKEKFEVMVKREAIKLAVEGLMNDEDEDEAQTRRNRAKEVAQMAKKAMEDEGSSHLNLTMMIAAITEELALKNKSIKDIV